MKSLTDLLTDIRKRAEAATSGPWSILLSDSYCAQSFVRVNEKNRDADEDIYVPTDRTDEDATFIAHARTDIPKLLAVIEKLREQRDECAADYEHHNVPASKEEIENMLAEDDAELISILQEGE